MVGDITGPSSTQQSRFNCDDSYAEDMFLALTYFKLSSTVLNPVGPFSLVNALRDLPPDAIHNLKLAFAPERSEEVLISYLKVKFP